MTAASDNREDVRKRTEKVRQTTEDHRLDDALADTFPASDPVSIAEPAADRERPDDPELKAVRKATAGSSSVPLAVSMAPGS